MAFSLQQPRARTKCLPPFFLDISEPSASLFLATMNNSNSSRSGRLYEYRISRTRSDPDERVMNALHKMQDYLQQIMVISWRRSQKTNTEQAASRTNGNAACEATEATAQARGRQEEARGFFGERKNVKSRRRDDLQRHHQRHSCKIRSAREIRQDRDHEGGVLGDHGGGLLQDVHRSTRSQEPVPRNENCTAQKEETSTRLEHKVCCFFPTSCQSPKRCGLMFA